MGEIIGMHRVTWTIIIKPGEADWIDIQEDGGLFVCMFTSDFDRIDNLRKQAEALLKQHKRRMDYVD